MNLFHFAAVNESFKDTSFILHHCSPQGQNPSEQCENLSYLQWLLPLRQ